MQFTPRLAGAMAVVVATGIAGGALLGQVPPIKLIGTDTTLPEARTLALDYLETRALPDHYPIVTPRGRFEVYELAERGLYSQARYAPYTFADRDAALVNARLDAAYAELVETEEEADAEARSVAPGPIETAAADTRAIRLDPSVRVRGEADAPAMPAITPRTIDVAMELAALH